MNTATIGAIILATSASLLLGMAALIKTMILGKLDALQITINDLSNDFHALDVRLTKLEAEHAMMHCHRRGGD